MKQYTWPDRFDVEAGRAVAEVSLESPPSQARIDTLVVELRWACDEIELLRAGVRHLAGGAIELLDGMP